MESIEWIKEQKENKDIGERSNDYDEKEYDEADNDLTAALAGLQTAGKM